MGLLHCKDYRANTCELHQAKRGLMVIFQNFVRYISSFDYYKGLYWFCANTFENKILQYFTETSESHVGYFQLWRHILRHLRHLLALCWKSHKPPFRLAQLMYSNLMHFSRGIMPCNKKIASIKTNAIAYVPLMTVVPCDLVILLCCKCTASLTCKWFCTCIITLLSSLFKAKLLVMHNDIC